MSESRIAFCERVADLIIGSPITGHWEISNTGIITGYIGRNLSNKKSIYIERY